MLKTTKSAADELKAELQGQSIEERIRQETLIDFCDNFLANLTENSDAGEHQTAKACFEALHGI